MNAKAAEKAAKEVVKNVILVHGDKGGVGKTMVATALVDWLIGEGKKVALIDADTRNTDTQRMFEGLIETRVVDLRHAEGWMDTFDFILQSPADSVVMSLAAGAGDLVISEIPQVWGQLNGACRLGMIWVINRGPDSVNLLGHTYEALKPHLAFTRVVKNLYFGTREKFSRWDESRLRKQLDASQSAPVTIEFQDLNDRVVDKIFNAADGVLPYSAIVKGPTEWALSDLKLSPSENLKLGQWLAANKALFGQMAEEVGL